MGLFDKLLKKEERPVIKIKAVSKVANPKGITYATSGSAGVDLRACFETPVPVILNPGERAMIPTGVAIEMPPDMVGLICPRSGLATKHGITIANSVGIADSDYRAEYKVILINHGKEPFVINHGDRIAQLLFMPVFQVQFEVVDELTPTERGTGGFGSTGIK